MKFFKICGLGQSKMMKPQNKNERMKKRRSIKQKTALPIQIKGSNIHLVYLHFFIPPPSELWLRI